MERDEMASLQARLTGLERERDDVVEGARLMSVRHEALLRESEGERQQAEARVASLEAAVGALRKALEDARVHIRLLSGTPPPPSRLTRGRSAIAAIDAALVAAPSRPDAERSDDG